MKKVYEVAGVRSSLMTGICLSLCVFGMNVFSQTFNVKDYGATGKKEQNAKAAIQKTIDACAANGGGMVYLPAGEYTSGTIHLKSNIRFRIESGATLYSIKDSASFDQQSLLYGENLQNITIEGQGTIDGQAAYDWKLNYIQDDYIRSNMEAEEATGKPLMRSFPKSNQWGHLIFLLNCKDVRLEGITLMRSPSWTVRPVHCQRMVIDGITIHNDSKLAVWGDGIDPDGCQHVRISNCNIETGDDALVFHSMNGYGPAQACDDITVSNCRFTSASSAIKFCDGNMNAIRHVTIDNCVITAANRGIAFMVFDGGEVSDIVMSNLVINCIRYDWFWWGDGDPIHFNIKRRSEMSKGYKVNNEPGPGRIKRVLISNVIANGKGSSICSGHTESWMEDITFNNVKLYISHDSLSDYDKSVNALKFQYVKNLSLKNVDIFWGSPKSAKWSSALTFEDINGLKLDGVTARQAKPGSTIPAITFTQVENATIRNSSPQTGTDTFMNFEGAKTNNILIYSNDFSKVKTPFTTDAAIGKTAIHSELNINPSN